jgi:hypothetical protein
MAQILDYNEMGGVGKLIKNEVSISYLDKKTQETIFLEFQELLGLS